MSITRRKMSQALQALRRYSKRSTARAVVLSSLCALAAGEHSHAGLPDVPGHDVTVYATMPPGGGAVDKITFDFDSGVLYGGNGAAEAAIYRVPAGGGEATTFGSPIPDPDAVIFDGEGSVSGVPGAVIVGGIIVLGSSAQLWAVLPDGQVISVCGPTGAFLNPTDMDFDSTGELLIADFNLPGVVEGAPCPTSLFETAASLAIIELDEDDRIYTVGSDGVLRIHSRNGDLIDGAFVTGLGGESPIQFGLADGSWGDWLYVIDRGGTGELRRYAADGSFEVIGTGFDSGRDIEFGPDGAMYVSMFDELRVLRVSPRSSGADLDGDGSIGFSDLLILLSAWGPCDPSPATCPADIDGSGDVGFSDLLLLLSRWGT